MSKINPYECLATHLCCITVNSFPCDAQADLIKGDLF